MEWALHLTKEQLQDILVEAVDDLIDYEYVRFPDDYLAPYWDGNGERLDGIESELDDAFLPRVNDEVSLPSTSQVVQSHFPHCNLNPCSCHDNTLIENA